MMRRMLVLVLYVTGAGAVHAAKDNALLEQARAAMRKAGAYWAKTVASHGGYVWEYSTDLKTWRRGESRNVPPSVLWVQPPGTPSVGMAFLAAYEATGERAYLDAALAAGHCLAWGQLHSGGWAYSIDFNLKTNRHYYWHLKPEFARAHHLRDTTTFDDNNTQSATRLLMALDRYVDDPKIDAAVQRALKCFLDAQYKGGKWDGAWPQRYPYPKRGYGMLPTFNDNTMSDCVRTMLAAAKQYPDRPELLASVKRCLEFYLRSQQPEPQAAWPQQLDKNLKPAWARKFEPPSISGGESCGNCRLLMDMYIEFGDQRYLDAVGKCVAWYKRSRIGGTEQNGVWARFYEPGTNKPLYFTRTYKLTYDDSDLPVHYSFKGNYGVNRMMRQYEELKRRGRAYYLKRREHKMTPAEWAAQAKALAPKVQSILAGLDAQGRWVKVVFKREQVRDKKGRVGYVVDRRTRIPMMYSRTFNRNMRTLARYITAAQGGPAIPPE